MALLEVEDLSKSFSDKISLFNANQFIAVNNVSFHLNRKRTLAIIGKNGSGKSTLAKMIVGVIPSSEGKIILRDKELIFGDHQYRAKHIRMMFQDPNSAFNPRLNVGQILDAPLRSLTELSEEERNEKIFKTLKLVGMYPDHANIKINTMSSSQKQRVALARALIMDPEIIIIDDALGGLDATVKTQLTNLLLSLQQRLGISYIYVGQHLGIIKHIADDVLVMDEGKMVEYGSTKTLFTQPKTDITKRLVISHFGRLLDESSWNMKQED